MLVPGTYERGIFGDLMLPGIACGIKKILLIFNTNLDSPHDPIYVVDPRQFDVNPDTELPIVLAYNMSHYESMNPCSEMDNQLTAVLVKEYSEGRYKFGRKDLPLFLELEATEGQQNYRTVVKKPRRDSEQLENVNHLNRAREKCAVKKDKSKADVINLEEVDDFLNISPDFAPSPTKKTRIKPLERNIDLDEVDKYLDTKKEMKLPTDDKHNLSKANCIFQY